MEVKQLVQDLVNDYKAQKALRHSIQLKLDQLDKIKKQYEAQYPDIKFYLSVLDGVFQMRVHSVGNVVPLDSGGFGKNDPEDVKYGIPSSPPAGWTESLLRETCSAIADELGATVEYSYLKVRTEPGIENISALRLLHPDANVQLVEKGRVFYVGWDCPDRYYKATINGDLCAFWSNDSHGGPVKEQAKYTDKASWQRFESFIQSAASVVSGW